MGSTFSKKYKIIAIVVGCVLISQIFMVSFGPIGWMGSTSSGEMADQDNQRIASEISNMTGISSDTILQLKAKGQSWNEIMEALKDGDDTVLQTEKNKRSLLLLETGLGEEAVNRLIDEGFDPEDISEAKRVAERVLFQMKELVQSSASFAPEAPSVNVLEHKEEDQLASYQSVAQQFELETAVQLMLSLQAEFGSFEAVLEEYLAALQLGLDLTEYLQDKEQYLQDKHQKSMERIGETIISLDKLEQMLLEKIQQENAIEMDELEVQKPSSELDLSNEQFQLPDMPSPAVKDIRPPNPTEQMMQEIQTINPNDSF